MIEPTYLHPRGHDLVGYIPEFLSVHDPLPAVQQLDANYKHGGGWRPIKGFKMDMKTHAIKYPGDPSYPPIAVIELRDEKIFVYPHAWVAVVQKDGSYEIARMD